MDLSTLLIFGLIDNGVLIMAFYFTYLNIEILIESKLNIQVRPFLVGVISAGIANTISDALGFLLQAEIIAGIIVGLGCLIAMALIPILEYIKNKKTDQDDRDSDFYNFK